MLSATSSFSTYFNDKEAPKKNNNGISFFVESTLQNQRSLPSLNGDRINHFWYAEASHFLTVSVSFALVLSLLWYSLNLNTDKFQFCFYFPVLMFCCWIFVEEKNVSSLVSWRRKMKRQTDRQIGCCTQAQQHQFIYVSNEFSCSPIVKPVLKLMIFELHQRANSFKWCSPIWFQTCSSSNHNLA